MKDFARKIFSNRKKELPQPQNIEQNNKNGNNIQGKTVVVNHYTFIFINGELQKENKDE